MRRASSAFFAFAVAACPAGAFDFLVTRYDDPAPDGCLADDCSLREAVIAANSAGGPDRVLLSAGTYRLTIVGNGEQFAATGDIDVRDDLEIRGIAAPVTIVDTDGLGEQPFTAAQGDIFTVRDLTLQNSDGGGLSLGGGTHLVDRCEIRDNASVGITVTIGAALTVRDTTIAGSGTHGMFVSQGSANIENSTITGSGQNELRINLAPSFSCTHCTIVDPADADAAINITESVANLSNSIVSGACNLGSGGSVASSGGNLESPGDTCTLLEAEDLFSVSNVDLALGALDDNGGPTRTLALGVGSDATGNADDASCLSSDQRGVVRETNCEVGSLEIAALAPPTPIFHDGFLQGDAQAWSETAGVEP